MPRGNEIFNKIVAHLKLAQNIPDSTGPITHNLYVNSVTIWILCPLNPAVIVESPKSEHTINQPNTKSLTCIRRYCSHI